MNPQPDFVPTVRIGLGPETVLTFTLDSEQPALAQLNQGSAAHLFNQPQILIGDGGSLAGILTERVNWIHFKFSQIPPWTFPFEVESIRWMDSETFAHHLKARGTTARIASATGLVGSEGRQFLRIHMIDGSMHGFECSTRIKAPSERAVVAHYMADLPAIVSEHPDGGLFILNMRRAVAWHAVPGSIEKPEAAWPGVLAP